MPDRLNLPDRPAILVVTLRRLGDVLLTTPLLRTLRRGYPDARIDVLVFAGTEGILDGNPDIDRVVTLKPRAPLRESFALIRRIGRRYDLAISTQTGDRPTLLAFTAARQRIGFVPSEGGGSWWKRRVMHRHVAADAQNHRVPEMLRLATCLGIDPSAEVVCPGGGVPDRFTRHGRYAVVHASPMFRYRRWTDGGWHELASALTRRGLTVVATGGADPNERAYLDALWGAGETPVARLDGTLDWPQLTALLRGAEVYVGTDTSVTHLAAATGCPTVALFGPTDPRLWGPWPAGGLRDTWNAADRVQRRGNVWLVQHALPCTPCQREGCERHLDSHAACLDAMSAFEVLFAVDCALGETREARVERRSA